MLKTGLKDKNGRDICTVNSVKLVTEDVTRMEVTDCSPCGRCQSEGGCDTCMRNPENYEESEHLEDNYYHA